MKESENDLPSLAELLAEEEVDKELKEKEWVEVRQSPGILFLIFVALGIPLIAVYLAQIHFIACLVVFPLAFSLYFLMSGKKRIRVTDDKEKIQEYVDALPYKVYRNMMPFCFKKGKCPDKAGNRCANFERAKRCKYTRVPTEGGK